MKAATSENWLELRLSEAKKASESWPSSKRESMMAYVAGERGASPESRDTGTITTQQTLENDQTRSS